MSLRTENLQYRKGEKIYLYPFTKDFEQGKIYALLGKNGSGKTTLLKILAGIWKHSSGKIFWHNSDLQTMERKTRSQLISYVPHSPTLPFDFTIREVVKMGGYCSSLINIENRVENALSTVDMLPLINRPITKISSGELARVYIARALVTDSPILLLDEPTSSLDIIQCQAIWELLYRLRVSGKTILVATHDLDGCSHYCDEALYMQIGRCKESSQKKPPLDKELLKKEYFEETVSTQ